MASSLGMFAALAVLATGAAVDLLPTDLRVEYQHTPVLSEPSPRFSFVPRCASADGALTECPRGQALATYRIRVVAADSTVMWDSGDVPSKQSSQIEYAGKNLTAYSTYTWSAQWSGTTKGSKALTASSTFEMGPISDADWKGAAWLAGPQLKADWQLPAITNEAGAKLVRARAYISSPGGYTLQVNGKAVGDQIGVSVWLRFDKSVVYQVHDITQFVENGGTNVVQLLVGKGFYGKTALRARLAAFYSDGKVVELGTAAQIAPNHWHECAGPVQSDDPFKGSAIDWRLDGANWQPAQTLAANPAGAMRALSIAPAGVLRKVRPSNVTKLSNGHLRFTFPENFVGVVQLKLARAPADGSSITIKHGEVLNASDGTVSFPWHETYQTDVHILGADMQAGTLLTPRFTWHGFQYAEVSQDANSGFDGQLDSVVGLVVGPAIDRTGQVSFSGSSDAKMLNAIQGLVIASQISNLAGYIPTDCPTREKHGWLGDAQVTAEEAMFNYDMAQIYTNYLQMIEDDQHPSDQKNAGDVLGVVPSRAKKDLSTESTSTSGKTDISWSAAYPLIARWMLRYYGDLRVAYRHWESMKTFVDQLTDYADSHCTGGLADYFTWGDWCPVEARSLATPGTGPELSAFNYILSLDAMAEMASALAVKYTKYNDATTPLDFAKDAAKYSALAKKFRPIFHSRFFNDSSSAYGARELELQSLTVAPLALGGVVPDAKLPAVLSSLAKDIKANDNHFTVGSVGAKHLLPQLTANGMHQQAMAIATQTSFPSFGHWLELGATTCWENYHGYADPSHPPPPTHNHIFLCGGVGEWMYRSVAGISPSSDGYSSFTIAPEMAGPTAASAQLSTVRGPAAVSWEAGQTSRSLNATVPIGSTAAVRFTSLPSSLSPANIVVMESGSKVWENGAFIKGAASGVISGRAVGQTAVEFEVGSGSFEFEAKQATEIVV